MNSLKSGMYRIVKTVKIFKDFIYDAYNFNKYYLVSAEKNGDEAYRVMLIVHSLEKGLSRTDARPFGQRKAAELIEILKRIDEASFEYSLGTSVLTSWLQKWKDEGWSLEKINSRDLSFIESLSQEKILAGSYTYQYEKSKDFDQTIFSRHSVRQFDTRELSTEDIRFAVECFQEAPSACNRQMCKVYRVRERSLKKQLSEKILGISGFDISSTTFFFVTYDIEAFHYSGERNQGMLNSGLAAMNFVNGLHSRGIGSCFLEWSNNNTEDRQMRHAMGLRDSERIAVVIGAGYYPKQNVLPRSCRRAMHEVYTEL